MSKLGTNIFLISTTSNYLLTFLSRDKGTTGQAKKFTKGRDRPGQPKSGTGRGTKWDRAEKDVLKQENDVLKQKMLF